MLKDIKIKRILLATDLLDSSRLALDYATVIAHYFKATLVMLNVIELSQAGMEAEMETRSPCMTRLCAQKRLDALAAGVRANEVLTETHVQKGVPWECILASVASYHADMLVLAVHGIHTRTFASAHRLKHGEDTDVRCLSDPYRWGSRSGGCRIRVPSEGDTLLLRPQSRRSGRSALCCMAR